MKRRRFLRRTLGIAGLTTIGCLRGNLFGAGGPGDALILGGTNSVAPGNFIRRFPNLARQGLNNPQLEEGLTELGLQMRDDVEKARTTHTPTPPFAGYTYLGQFIDHDLTFDLTSLKDAQSDADKTPNFRTPFLDLDHVYGGGPNLSPFLYQNKQENRRAERFLIGKTKSTKGGGAISDNDLPRNLEGVALAGDSRQDENLILGQLHVLFLKLHNWLLDNPHALSLSPHYAAAGAPFAQAQRVLRWHYQWIVVHDFLKRILDPAAHTSVLEAEGGPLPPPGLFRIPIEFSVAAFRFGHTMVRNAYVINSRHSHSELIQLLSLTGRQGLVGAEMPLRLPEEWRVDWRFFFPVEAAGAVQHSGAIDTRISIGLYDVPMRVQKLFSAAAALPEEEFRLPIRSLLRGARVGLPSGQDVAEALGCDVLHGDRIVIGTAPEEEDVLRKHNFLEDTPLWYYFLKEAEILGTGGRLGPAGSKLIADVFIGALRSTPDSYLSAGGTWLPTLPIGWPKNDQRAFDMSDLIRLVS